MEIYAEKLSERRLLSRAIWAGMFLMAGAVFLADSLGYLPTFGNAGPWHWVALGAGGLFLLGALVRTVSTDRRGLPTGELILGIALIFVGASAIFGVRLDDWRQWWPIILIVLGLMGLLRAIRS